MAEKKKKKVFKKTGQGLDDAPVKIGNFLKACNS